MKTTLNNAKLFIVPNSLISYHSTLWNRASRPEDWAESGNFTHFKDSLKPFGVDVKPDDRMVQIWITSDSEDNLSDHGLSRSEVRELFPNGGEYAVDGDPNRVFAPRFLPAKIFDGKKEGDKIILTTVDGVEWEIELCQLKYRYRRFGRFEDVLKVLVDKDATDEKSHIEKWFAKSA